MGFEMWHHSALACVIIGLTACSIHPSVEEVTTYEPADIVRKIRCEARGTISDKIKAWLRTQQGDLEAQNVVAQLDAKVDIRSAGLSKMSPETKYYIDRFNTAAIAYDFTLNITQTNSASGSLDIARIFTAGNAAFGITASADLTRNNITSFLITETFNSLIFDVELGYCEGQDTRTANFLYPIVGNIGLNKPIDTFIDLSLFGALAGKEKGPPTLSTSLEFTTKISGSVSPAVTFVPAGLGTRFAGASGTGTISREDKHKIIVGLSLPAAKGPTRKLTDSLPGRIVNISPLAKGSEIQAADAVAQHILRFDIPRREQTIIYQSILPFF